VTSVTRSSVARVTREISEVVRIAAMKVEQAWYQDHG
jgi:hypothetical protein